MFVVTGLHDIDEYIQAQLLLAVSTRCLLYLLFRRVHPGSAAAGGKYPRHTVCCTCCLDEYIQAQLLRAISTRSILFGVLVVSIVLLVYPIRSFFAFCLFCPIHSILRLCLLKSLNPFRSLRCAFCTS